MASFDELMREITSLKQSSEELSTMIKYAGDELNNNSTTIMALGGRISESGRRAASAVGVASRSLLQASASMLTLSHTCDECVAQLSK